MARRGRKASLSPQQQKQRKDAKAAQKAQAMASNALAKLPAEVERRNEFWHQLEALEAKGQAVNGEKSQHIKRMHEVFGITKQAMRIRKILVGCPDGDYEATVEQIMLFMRDYNRPIQIDMFKLEPGKGVGSDDGPIFDGTGAGERHSAERLDDPARARRVPEPAPVPNGPTPVVSLEEAERLFRERQHLAPQPRSPAPSEEEAAANAAAIAAQKAQDAQEFEKAPDPANDAEAAIEAPKRRGRRPMTEEQKAAAKAERLATKGKPAPTKEVKAKADKYVAEQENRLNGNGGPPPAPFDEEEPHTAAALPVPEDDEADGRYQILN